MRIGIQFSINIENHFRYLSKVENFRENEVEIRGKCLTKVVRHFRENLANLV